MRTVQLRAMWSATGVVLASLALAAPTTGATGDPGDVPKLVPKSPALARELHARQRAAQFVFTATLRVVKRRRTCVPADPGAAPTSIDGPPTRALRDLLAPLRRPATADDAAPAGSLDGLGPVYRDATRRFETRDGHRLLLAVSRFRAESFTLPRGCATAIGREATRAASHAPRLVRRFVRQAVREISATPTPSQVRPRDLVWMLGPSWSRTFVAVGDTATLRRRGLTGVTGSAVHGWVGGLVPDGVAGVVLHYPRVQDQGRYYRPTRYPSAVTVTAPVGDNVFGVAIPRPRRDGNPASIEWLDADGKLIRRVRPTGVFPP